MPDIRERLDASLALCQLRFSFGPSYQADFAAGAVAKFLVELGKLANDDKDRKYLAWQLQADHLKRGLDLLAQQANLPNATAAYITALAAAAKPLLEYFDDAAKNPTAVQAFAGWLQDNQPAAKEIYKPLGQK